MHPYPVSSAGFWFQVSTLWELACTLPLQLGEVVNVKLSDSPDQASEIRPVQA